MLEIMSESQGNVLAVKAQDKLTEGDYRELFIPTLEALLQEHGKVRLLFLLDESFAGWELGALWEDAKFGLKHKDDFEKLAVVGGAKWVAWGTRLFAYFMEGQVKTFPLEELSAAREWIKS
jgi:hypothetical protein